MSNALTLKMDDKGVIKMNSLQDQMSFAEHLIRSGMLPKAYDRPEKVVAAWQLAADVGLKPGVKVLGRIANINGTPNLFAEGPLSVCQAAGVLEAFEGYYVDPEGERICAANKNLKKKRWGYIFRAKRKGNEFWHEESYDLDQAKQAGLGNVWNKHPDDLLKWRTTTKNLKFTCADILMGVQVAEYDNNTVVTDAGPVGGLTDVDSDLNERLEEPGNRPPPIPVEGVVVPDPVKNYPLLPNAGDYVIGLGAHSGKRLRDLPLDDAFKLATDSKQYADSPISADAVPELRMVEEERRETAQEIFEKATEWIESQKGF